MLPLIPALKGRDVIRIFEALGWQGARQNGYFTVAKFLAAAD